MNVLTRGMRNAFRNPVRTLSIVVILGLSIGLSLAMLIANQAVSDKIDSVKASVGNTITIQPAGYSPMSDANNALSGSDLDKVTKLDHVTKVAENLSGQLTTEGSSSLSMFGSQSSDSNTTTNLKSAIELQAGDNESGSSEGPKLIINGGTRNLPAGFTPPLQVLGTTDPSQLNGSSISVTSGSAIDGSKDTNNVLVSTALAQKNSLKVGSTFKAYDQTLTVAGIFESGTQGGNNTIVMSLSALQRLSDQEGAISSAIATVDSLDNLASTTAATKNTLGDDADVQSSQEQADNTVKPLQSIQSVSLYSLIGAVGAGAVIILLTMIMIVRERRREIGVIKAIGASNVKVMSQFMVEAITLTVLGAVIGILLGVVAGNPITKMLVDNSTSSGPTMRMGGGPGGAVRGAFGGFQNSVSNITASIGWDIILYGLAAAVIIAVIGSTIASFFIAKVRPAEVMRVE